MHLLRHVWLLVIYAQCCVVNANTNDNEAAWKNPAALNHASGSSSSTAFAAPTYDARVSDGIAESVLQFAHNVGQQLNDNLHLATSEVFSPVSVMSALALLMLGAKGTSYEELSNLFRFAVPVSATSFHEEFGNMIKDMQQAPYEATTRLRNRDNWRNTFSSSNIRVAGKTADSNKPIEHVVKVANGLFEQIGYSLNPDYRNVIAAVYGSELMQLDFQTSAARDYINEWVSSKTFGKIPKIITDSIPRDTNIIIASALYFKGFWDTSFFEQATTLDNFYPDGFRRPSVKVPMMATGGAFPFYDSAEYGCRIIGLPYMGNLTTMYVIQPHNSTRAKLKALQSYLDASKIEEMISKMVYKSTLLAFPKMHLVRSINMKTILNQLGLHQIFHRGQSDLSLIGGTVNNVLNNATSLNENSWRNTGGILNGPVYGPPAFIFPGQSSRSRREAANSPYEQLLQRLESQRNLLNNQPGDLFVEDILHKVDFDVNEEGTEAAAATLTYLKRSGTDVLFRAETPFLIIIRHDPTKLVLFYGIINIPQV